MPLRILQVEDDATNRQVAERSLDRAGHSVTNVENGRNALAALQSGDFDLVLMDRHLPVMDGIETTKTIRATDGPVAGIPIVGLTAGATQVKIDACMASGMNICLTKPVNPRVLIETVQRYGLKDAAHPAIAGSGRFLFVDDDPTAGNVAARQFAKLGRECDVAVSGAEALQLVKARRWEMNESAEDRYL